MKKNIIESKMSFNKSKSGSITPRAILPISWVRELGITENSAGYYRYKIFNKIIITKEELKMTIDEIKKVIKEELVSEIEKIGYICDSDRTDRLVDVLIKKYIKLLEGIEEMEIDPILEVPEELFYKIEEEMRDFLKQKYYQVGVDINGDYSGYFTKSKFESLKEFEEKFNIGE